MELVGRLVRLAPLGPEHVDALVEAASSRDHYEFAFVPAGREAMEAYVARAIAAPDQIPFATVRLADETVVGSTRFGATTPWQWPPGHPSQRRDRPDVVEIGHSWLATSAQRTGINRDAKLLMLTHAFDVWDVHLVRIRTDVRNVQSRRAIEGLGATFDGVLRADRPGADGTVRDSAYYSISRGEWPAVRARLTT